MPETSKELKRKLYSCLLRKSVEESTPSEINIMFELLKDEEIQSILDEGGEPIEKETK